MALPLTSPGTDQGQGPHQDFPSTQKNPSNCAWARAVYSTAQEFGPTELPLLSGAIPPDLNGQFYQNGPGCLERGGQRCGHWFDGEGGILGVTFAAGTATARYRYVASAARQAELAADRFLFGNYGMTAPGPLWQRWGKPLKNAANTSVLALPDRLLALWEGAEPHRLDRESLETLGLDSLGQLRSGEAYSAHPRVDPTSGEIFNFGLGMGPKVIGGQACIARLNLFRSDATGQIQQRNAYPLDGIPLIHDFVLAGPYLLFCIAPVRMNLLQAGLGLVSFSEALDWQPDRGTTLLIFDRHSLELVSRREVDPWYQWHFGNGYFCESGADAGKIIATLVRYDDFATNQYLQEVATGQTATIAPGYLWELAIDPTTARLDRSIPLGDAACEFPLVASPQSGQPQDRTYLVTHRPGQGPGPELFGAIGVYDHRHHRWTIANCGPDHYPFGPVHVSNFTDAPRDWLVTVLFNGQLDQSEIWIFEAQSLEKGPICKLLLPGIIPFGFHGTWGDST
jgi:all-trans-8'-apo-beta-carotenal 15,15'-oxygenase